MGGQSITWIIHPRGTGSRKRIIEGKIEIETRKVNFKDEPLV